jgi:hypothetical protein
MNRIDKIIDEVETENGDIIVTLSKSQWGEVKSILRMAQGAYADLAQCNMNEAAISLGEICEDD